MTTTRTGAISLAELILVFWLFAFVLAAVAGVATSVGRLSAVQRDRTRGQEVVRATRVILSGELRHALAAQLVAAGGDSLRLRAARGAGAICAVDREDLVVRYRGVRRPEPAKDSLLLVTATGPREAGAVTTVRGTERCGGGLVLRVEGGPPEPRGLVVVYEGGTYHIQGGALRYRRGAAGRQPLTESLLHRSSALESAGGRVEVRLLLRGDSLRSSAGATIRHPVARLNPRRAP